jgi:hypothetical protein
MCPAHRERTLKKICLRLAKGKPIHLIATQCVEAGVDLDFPVVYRALAPLEAIAQATGRCNRHGNRQLGRVVVFKPQGEDGKGLYPPGYDAAVSATEIFLNELALHENLDAIDILGDPKRIEQYYRHFYGLTGKGTMEDDRERPLLDAIRGGDFSEVAKRYKLIENDSIRVLTSYKGKTFERLRDEIETTDPFSLEFIRDWMRRASPYAINLYRPKPDAAIASYLQPIQFSHRRTVDTAEADWFYTLPGVSYDRLLGISTEVEKVWIV